MAKPSLDALAQEMSAALGTRLVSLVLYGSAARGDQVPKHSDVNTLLVCDAVDEELFARLTQALAGWMKAGFSPPLILTEGEWRSAADAFPIEYQDIREAHRVLAGRDLWDEVTVKREDLRRQLEHELMGKLVHLRQAYAALREKPAPLAEVILASAAGFFAMLRAALRLSGVTPPAGYEALVREAGQTLGFDPTDLSGLVTHVSGGSVLRLRTGDRMPVTYLNALAQTAAYVHHLERKAP